MQPFTREEIDQRLRAADRARLALRRATRELATLGDTLLAQRGDHAAAKRPGSDATREPSA